MHSRRTARLHTPPCPGSRPTRRTTFWLEPLEWLEEHLQVQPHAPHAQVTFPSTGAGQLTPFRFQECQTYAKTQSTISAGHSGPSATTTAPPQKLLALSSSHPGRGIDRAPFCSASSHAASHVPLDARRELRPCSCNSNFAIYQPWAGWSGGYAYPFSSQARSPRAHTTSEDSWPPWPSSPRISTGALLTGAVLTPGTGLSIQAYVIFVLVTTATAAAVAPTKPSRIAVLIVLPSLGVTLFLIVLALFISNANH